MKTRFLAILAIGLLGGPIAAKAVPTVVNFDDQAPADCKAGNTYAAAGVLFSTIQIPDSIDAVDEQFGYYDSTDCFWLINNDNSISSPGFAAAYQGGTNDLLMHFTTPITSLQLTTDDTSEVPDIVRLLALEYVGYSDASGEVFRVLAVDWGYDDATSSPDNVLFVSLGGASFSYALFQTTTEQEGFDDLAFDQVTESVPEPGTLALLGFGLAALGLTRRRKLN